MDAGHAGMRLVADIQRFPRFTEIIGDAFGVGRVGVHRKVAAVGCLQHIGDAGEVTLCKLRRVHAALRGTARVKTLHHRAFLRCHQATGLRAGHAQRVLELLRT